MQQYGILRINRYDATEIIWDYPSVQVHLKNKIAGVDIRPRGAEDYVPKADERILRIKEKYRSVYFELKNNQE